MHPVYDEALALPSLSPPDRSGRRLGTATVDGD
jgi:hypothetical protein